MFHYTLVEAFNKSVTFIESNYARFTLDYLRVMRSNIVIHFVYHKMVLTERLACVCVRFFFFREFRYA